MALKDWKKQDGFRWVRKKGNRKMVMTHTLNGRYEGQVGIQVTSNNPSSVSQTIYLERYFGKDNKTNQSKALAYAKKYMRSH